jgi:hypothetical protein
MTLALPDVTLCAVTAVNHDLTVRAMKECLRHCSFADVVLISDRPVEAPFRVELMPPFGHGSEYAPFVCRNLTKYTPSAFNLLVQYDGYVVDPSAWDARFFDYDYIGAKWPWHKSKNRVGNSGFCLRSKKLLDILAEIPLPPTGEFVDDTFICYTARKFLEQNHGIKIATEEVADRFAYERHEPEGPVFGFHGMFNFWRHIGDAEMEKIPQQLDDFYVPSRAFVEILLHYYVEGKGGVFASWYRRLHAHMGEEGVRGHLLSYVNDPPFIDKLMKAGENFAA